MNKTKWGSILLLIAIFSSANARERREPCCAPHVSTHAATPCLIRPNECDGPNLCPLYPELDCSAYMHFDIGFLYEQVRVTGSEFAYTVCGDCDDSPGAAQPGGGPQVPWSGCAINPEFDMQFGVTVGLGYYACWDDWYFRAQFDWLKSTTCMNYEGDCNRGNTVMPNGMWIANMVRGSGATSGSCEDPLACSKRLCDTMSANYYMLEFNVNRGSFVSLALAIEPFAGLKTVWTEFCHHSEFESQNNPSSASSSGVFVNRHQRAQFWGIGPEWGLNTQWFLIEGVSFFCDPTVAILFGHTVVKDVTYNDAGKCSPCDPCDSECRVEFCNSLRMMSPNLRTILGFQWDRDVCANTQHLSIKAGLDVNYFWNQNLTVDWVSNRGFANIRGNDHNTFSLLGLYFAVGWDF